MPLGLSLGSGNWREEMWIEIFDRAKKRGKIVRTQLGSHEFEYAMINPQDDYDQDELSAAGDPYHYRSNNNFWIQDAEKEGRVGLNEGGLAFVLERTLPKKDFAGYVGLHEHIEATQGKSQHGEACKSELTEVLKQNPEFIDAYANWLVGLTHASENPERGYFARAIPDFFKVVKEGRLSPTEVLREFKGQLDAGYHLK